MNNKEFSKLVKKSESQTPIFKNCVKAFLTGGTVCIIAELLFDTFISLNIPEADSRLLSSVSLIFISSLLTGIGVYDKIAKFGRGGALVPITGFSNAVTSAAIEAKSEGLILGTGTKMFNIAGPVIVFGTASSILYGIIYWIILNFN